MVDERLLTLIRSAQTSTLIAGAFQASTANVSPFTTQPLPASTTTLPGVLVHNKTDAAAFRPRSRGVCTPKHRLSRPDAPDERVRELNQVVAVPMQDTPTRGGPILGRLTRDLSGSMLSTGTTLRSTSAPICSGGFGAPSPRIWPSTS